MSIIATTDFKLNQSLPIDKVSAVLQQYIDKYEPRILTRVLGYQLYKEFNTAIAGSSPAQKWIDLRDGSEYTYSSELRYFDGLKTLTVNYVYFKFIKEQSQFNTGVGIKSINTENSENTDSSFKQVYAFNELVDINEQLYEFITAKNDEVADTYENYDYTEICKVNEFNI